MPSKTHTLDHDQPTKYYNNNVKYNNKTSTRFYPQILGLPPEIRL